MAFERRRSMAAVKIALGFGRHATLDNSVSSGALTFQQRRDADEFLRIWPIASVGNKTHRALDYIRRLGLRASYGAAGDAVALLRSAIRGGGVSVAIERTATQSGASGGTGKPVARRAMAAGPSFTPFSNLESIKPINRPPSSCEPITARSWATPSDVSADELVSYLQSVVEHWSEGATRQAGDCLTSTLLDNAQPFEYLELSPGNDILEIAKTPNAGKPGTWYTNPGSGQMRLYGQDGRPAVDIDFDHDHGQGIPHAHNWAIDPFSGRLRRGPGVPLTILP